MLAATEFQDSSVILGDAAMDANCKERFSMKLKAQEINNQAIDARKPIRLGGRPPIAKFGASIPRNDLRKYAFIEACKPPSVGWCWESSFQQFVGTNWFQWFGNRNDGKWHPWGKPMHLDVSDAK